MKNEDMLRLMKALALPVEAVALEIVRFAPTALPGVGRKKVGVYGAARLSDAQER
jgi:hypothetical protein